MSFALKTTPVAAIIRIHLSPSIGMVDLLREVQLSSFLLSNLKQEKRTEKKTSLTKVAMMMIPRTSNVSYGLS